MTPTRRAHRKQHPAGSRGFTVIELVMVLLIFALMYGTGTYMLYGAQRPREAQVHMQLQNLANGVYGRGLEEHGYVADHGELPIPGTGEILSDYLSRPPLPNPDHEHRENRIPVGWHGPYASYDTSIIDQDPWGNPWILDPVTGQIGSLGRDGQVSADDLVIPDYAPIPRGTVVGQVAVIVIDPKTGARVSDPTQLEVWVSDFPDDRQAIYEPSIGAFIADDLAPGRKRIDIRGDDLLTGANAFKEVLLPLGGVTTATLHLDRTIFFE